MTADAIVRIALEHQELTVREWPASIFAIGFIKRENPHEDHRRHGLQLTLEASPEGQATECGKQRSVFGLRDAQHASHERFAEAAVGIREQYPRASRVLSTHTRRVALARPIIWAMGIFDVSNARIAFRGSDQQFPRVICATIEHIDRFELHANLRAQSSNAVCDHATLIVRGDDDRKFFRNVRQRVCIFDAWNRRERARNPHEQHEPIQHTCDGESKDGPTEWGHEKQATAARRRGRVLHAILRHVVPEIATLSVDTKLVYAPLLANRYLTSRVIPFIAVGAVAMCVALVIIVVSVMSGFLNMVRETGRSQIGDVVVSHDVVGIPFYEEFITLLKALPEVQAASPVIETFGLVQMPYGVGGGKRVETVQVWGIDPVSFDETTGYQKTLYWKTPPAEKLAELDETDPRRSPLYDGLADAMAMRKLSTGEDGVVLGIEFSPFNERRRDGTYRTVNPVTGEQSRQYWMPATDGITLTLVAVSDRGSLQAEKKRAFRVVNEFESGVYQIDSQRVLIPLKAAQEMLRLDSAPIVSRTEVEADGRPKVLGQSAARATTILVKAREGTTAVQLKEAVSAGYAKFLAQLGDERVIAERVPPYVDVRTWEERLKDLIGPVEKERELMRTLFSIIYLVCAGLVLSIFWAIVAEKTRDIGILRAIGASRAGILWIFLRYGLFIGLVGSATGVGIAALVVSRINDIHSALGVPAPMWLKIFMMLLAVLAIVATIRSVMLTRALATVLCGFGTIALLGIATLLWFHQGIQIWDPSVYYFSKIPSDLDLFTAATTAVGGVIFSVIGAAVPAAKAADTDPVRSLRYE